MFANLVLTIKHRHELLSAQSLSQQSQFDANASSYMDSKNPGPSPCELE